MGARGRRPGAPLNEDTIEKVLGYAKRGATNHVIAAGLGIHPDTFQTWLRRGRDSLSATPEDVDRELTVHEQLFLRLEETRAEVAADMSEIVLDAAMSRQPNTWQAAMTFLERRYPHEWGKRETRVLEGTGATLPQINVLVLNDPDARTAHRDLLRSVDAAASARPGIPERASVGGAIEGGREDGRDDAAVA